MSEHAEQPMALPLPRSGAMPEQVLKSLAKNLARDSTAEISDRHVRAQVRTRCYNQLLSLLRQIDDQRTADRQRQRRLLSVAGGLVVALATVLAGSLML